MSVRNGFMTASASKSNHLFSNYKHNPWQP